MLLTFIYALVGMNVYGGKFVFEDNPYRQNFDSFPNAVMTVF